MVMYTRRHYIQIGNTIKNSRNKRRETEKWVRIFKADNPRFDEQRFREFVAGKRSR